MSAETNFLLYLPWGCWSDLVSTSPINHISTSLTLPIDTLAPKREQQPLVYILEFAQTPFICHCTVTAQSHLHELRREQRSCAAYALSALSKQAPCAGIVSKSNPKIIRAGVSPVSRRSAIISQLGHGDIDFCVFELSGTK